MRLRCCSQEASSSFLRTTTYHILANPETHSKLKAELKQPIPDPASIPPLAELEQLPQLHAIVQEDHRLSDGVVGWLQRISPDKTLQFQDWIILTGTPVSMTELVQHMDPSKFPNPTTFSPNRWLNSPTKAEKYLVPFSKGTRQCMGINLATAAVYLNPWRRFSTGSTWSFVRLRREMSRSRMINSTFTALVTRKVSELCLNEWAQ
jgi:cytochrome P450